jgi:hypothetical protein
VRRKKSLKQARTVARKLVKEKPALLAEFVARMLGDGSLQLKNPSYRAYNIESHKRMQELCHKLLGFIPCHNKKHRTSYVRRISAYVLKELGVPLGRKTLTNPHFPDFIMKSDSKEVIIHAISGFIDDEGCLGESGVYVRNAIQIGGKKLAEKFVEKFRERKHVGKCEMLREFPDLEVPIPNLLMDLSKLLKKLDIKNTVHLRGFYRTERLTYVCADCSLFIPKGEFTNTEKLRILPKRIRRCLRLVDVKNANLS